MPEVSVIIPAYNSGQFLGEAIQSVLAQTFQDFEIIVVDDGSTDNTKDVIESFKDRRVKYIRQENRGVSAARNMGISSSTAEYVSFLDADDIWLPRKLELQINAMESARQVGVVYSDLYYYDSAAGSTRGTFVQKLRWPFPRGNVLDKLVEHFFGHPSTLLVRRNVFGEIGMFDETLKNCEDDDMLFRMASHFGFEVVPVPLVKSRIHAGQLSRKREEAEYYYIAYLNKALRSPVIDREMRIKLRKSLARRHLRYGELLIRSGRLGSGVRQLQASTRVDFLTFCSLTALLPGRIVVYFLAFTYALMRRGKKVLWRHQN